MAIKLFKIITNRFISCITILLVIVSCNGDGNQKNRPNLIILLLDCVRADHLSCYGYYRDTSPHIDALAAQGIKFNRAISQAPWTLPSVVSLLTGYYAHRHGVGNIGKEGRDLSRDRKKYIKMLDADTPLLPELLRQDGYQTWGYSGNPWIKRLITDRDRIGEKGGFVEFKYQSKAPAGEVVDYGIEKIMLAKENRKPFFLYLHFMDAHQPLTPPAKYYSYFPTSTGKNNSKIHERWEFRSYEAQKGVEFENYREHKLSLNDGAIRYMDNEIGRLIKFLKNSKLMTNTIVVVVSDHGNEFWDHAAFEANHYQYPWNMFGVAHGHTMFQELLWVPLIITNLHSAGKFISLFKREQKEIQNMVRLIDVFPTLLERIGFQTIPDSDGESLFSLINSSDAHSSSRLIFSGSPSYGNLKISLIEPPYKYIYSYKEADALFDLLEDPQESNNLLEKHQELASDMLKKIYHIMDEKADHTEKMILNEEDLEALKGLGYID